MKSDRYEHGPSYAWPSIKTFNFWQRSKYLTFADDDTMTGVHECCCIHSREGVCERPGGAGMRKKVPSPIAPCASVEHMPLEFWEIRHFKYGLARLAPAGSPAWCVNHSGVSVVQISPDDLRGRKRRVNGSLETRREIPAAWAEAIQHAVRAILLRMGAAALVAPRRSSVE